MASLLQRVWWRLTLGAGWDTVRRTVRHASAGELHYEGKRSRPGGPVHGLWRVARPDVVRPITIGFPTLGEEPTPFYLDRLASMLADPDALFERFRPAIAPVYLEWIETPLPADWRSVFRLDGLDLPPAPEDVEADGALWQVTWWCSPAEHWFVVHLDGDAIIDVEVAG